jgi:hypothetical protein
MRSTRNLPATTVPTATLGEMAEGEIEPFGKAHHYRIEQPKTIALEVIGYFSTDWVGSRADGHVGNMK